MTQPPPLPPINPYAAPSARVDDFRDGELVLADRGVRLLAAIIDLVLMLGLVMVLGFIAAITLPAFSKDSQSQQTAFAVVGLVAIAAFLAVVIINFVLVHRYGQTIGKRIMKVKIVRADGSRCSLLRYIFARGLPVGLLSAIPLIGYIVSLVDPLMIFRADQRCLHDLIADTIVVKA